MCICINCFAVPNVNVEWGEIIDIVEQPVEYKLIDEAFFNLCQPANNICVFEKKSIFEFKRLERGMKQLTKSNVNNFGIGFMRVADTEEIAIKSKSLADALNKYFEIYYDDTQEDNSCCIPKHKNLHDKRNKHDKIDGVELRKLYIQELEKYNFKF